MGARDEIGLYDEMRWGRITSHDDTLGDDEYGEWGGYHDERRC